jgi:hypothetical protein
VSPHISTVSSSRAIQRRSISTSGPIGTGILVTHSQSGGPGWLTAIKSQNGYVGLDPNYGPAADRRKGISVILGRRRTVKICSIWSPGPAFTLDTSKTAQR